MRLALSALTIVSISFYIFFFKCDVYDSKFFEKLLHNAPSNKDLRLLREKPANLKE